MERSFREVPWEKRWPEGYWTQTASRAQGGDATSHITAAVRATDYVRKVRAALAAKRAATAAAAAVILTEDEEDGEEVWD